MLEDMKTKGTLKYANSKKVDIKDLTLGDCKVVAKGTKRTRYSTNVIVMVGKNEYSYLSFQLITKSLEYSFEIFKDRFSNGQGEHYFKIKYSAPLPRSGVPFGGKMNILKDNMTTNKLTRGIDEKFAEAFKKSELYALYKKHSNEIFIGVCNNYLHLYYNCNSIAKVEYKKEKINCKTAKNILRDTDISNPQEISSSQITKNYKQIKNNIERMPTPEKKAQSKLVLLNNANKKSEWFCIDIEWAKSGFSGRFDIVAISKEIPHSVALVELKYGSQAIGGKCGIRRHAEDFYKFQKNKYFEKYLKQDIVGIVKSRQMLELDLPDWLQYLTADNITDYNFYVITLDNNGETERHSTPKQTMAGYLFNNFRWGCKKLAAPPSVEEKFGDVTKKSNRPQVTFLFSKQTLDNLNINDVIYGNYDDKEIPQ